MLNKFLGVVEGLQSDHQPQQNRGTVPAYSKHHIREAKHQHRWHAVGKCRQLQVPGLVSIILNDGSLIKKSRPGSANQALGRLRTKVLNHHNICLYEGESLSRAIVFTALQCECETWTWYRRRVKQLETFHMRALRSILGMRWQDCITNLEVPDRAQCISIQTLLIKPQLRWVGQIIRMDDPHMSRQLLYGELARVTRTLWRGTFSCEASSWKTLRLQTVTEVNGAHRPSLFPPVSRTTALTDAWQQPMNDAKEHSLLVSQKRSSNAPPATHNSSLPDWVCRATRESMDDHTTRSPQHTVFFGQDGQPPNKHV